MSIPEKTTVRVEFVEPASLTDAELQRRHLTEKIGDIATQLSDRDRRHPDGTRFTDHEYHDWRRRALGALRAHERVLRQINDWIKQERRNARALETASLDDKEMFQRINAAYKLFVKLREEGVDFTPEEWTIIEQLRACLDKPQQSESSCL